MYTHKVCKINYSYATLKILLKVLGNEAILFSDVLYCENLFKNFNYIKNALESLTQT